MDAANKPMVLSQNMLLICCKVMNQTNETENTIMLHHSSALCSLPCGPRSSQLHPAANIPQS